MTSTEVLSLSGSSDNWAWSNSQNLPLGLVNQNGAVASRADVYLGFNVGGTSLPAIDDTIYGLRQTNQGLQWEEVRKLNAGTYYHSVVNAPSNIIPSC